MLLIACAPYSPAPAVLLNARLRARESGSGGLAVQAALLLLKEPSVPLKQGDEKTHKWMNGSDANECTLNYSVTTRQRRELWVEQICSLNAKDQRTLKPTIT